MATVSTLAIKVIGQDSLFLETMKSTVSTVDRVAASVVRNNAAVRVSSNAWNAANTAAKGYLKTILGIAGAGTVVARGVQAYAQKQDQSGAQVKADAAGNVISLTNAYHSLTGAVDEAHLAFGTAFAESAHLTDTAAQLRTVVQSLTPAFALAGKIAGATFNFFVNYPPLFLAIAAACKILAAVLGVIVHVLFVRLIVRGVTWLLLGTAMTPITLAWAAAQWILNAALWAGSAALAVMALIGAPIWLAIGAAIAAVALVTYGLIKAWQWLTTSTKQQSRIAEMQAMHKKMEEATKDVRSYIDALEEANAVAGLSDNEKKQREFGKLLDEAKNKVNAAGGSFDRSYWERELKAQLDIADAAEKRKKVAEAIRDIEKELADVGRSEAHKASDKVKDAGGSRDEIERAFAIGEQIEAKKKLLEATKQIADIEKEASLAGLSDIEKRVALLREAGASELQIASIRARLEGAETAKRAAEDRKKVEEEIARLQSEAADAFLTEGEKRIEQLKRLGATEEQIRQAESHAAALDAARNAKTIADSVETPLEKMRKNLEAIEQARQQGAITDNIADRARTKEQLEGYKAALESRKPAEQGGAITRGSQADIAARFQQRPELKTNEQILTENRKQALLLEKIHGKLQAPPVLAVAKD